MSKGKTLRFSLWISSLAVVSAFGGGCGLALGLGDFEDAPGATGGGGGATNTSTGASSSPSTSASSGGRGGTGSGTATTSSSPSSSTGAIGGGGSGGGTVVMNPPVVTGLDPVTVDELVAFTVDLSATDPVGGNVVLTANNLPGNAKFTASGAAATLTWTPSYTDAGKYTVKITATPDDASRTATFDLVITVKNAADPILIDGNPVRTMIPIGDFDKDGFGDLASCTGDAAGANGSYHIQIVYGAATGLPLDAAGATGRVDSFDIAATGLGGVEYSCKGGDFDGDGHADIIFADPANDYWGAGTGQGKFTVLFGGERGAPPPTIYLAGPENFGQHMGTVFDVGDFTADGKADIATVWSVNAGTAVLFAGGPRSNQMGSSNGQDYGEESSICLPPISLAMVDLNGDGNADWVLQDTGINAPSSGGSCDAAHMAGGGLRIIPGRSTAPLLDGSNTATYQEYYAPATVPAAERYRWGRQGSAPPSTAGCDIDADGFGDLGLLPTWTGSASEHGEVYYGSASGLVATPRVPLGDTAANSFDVASMQPVSIACFGSYKAGRPALAVSAMPTVNGPGEVHLFTGRPLVQVGTIPSPSAGDSHFGATMRSGNHTDVDGDGKEDLVVISDQSGWVIYGR